MRDLVRQPQWRNNLLTWAKAVHGRPYVWGTTDCASLVRGALKEQFGEDVLGLPGWGSLRLAQRVWLPLSCNGGPATIFERLGAQRLNARRNGARYPMGSILVLTRDPEVDDMRFPSFGVGVGPVVLQSNYNQGVYCDMNCGVEEAWLFEELTLDG
jgi:hypothetical protein